MEKVMCSYETLFVVRPDLGEEATEAVVNKFTSLIADNGGAVESVNAWGKRRLAYLPLELNRVFGITDEIMRYIVVRSCGVAAPATEEKAPEAPAAEEAPAEAAAE